MENQAKSSEAATTEQIIKQVISSWSTQNKSVTDFFNQFDEATYSNAVAPGRNRAIYLLGHLVAVNDGMLPILGLGDRLFPHLEPIFESSPDRHDASFPTLVELKQHWEQLNTTLASHFNTMSWQDWVERHTIVSPEDFALNPMRNKLNVLINRTNHQSYHLGQLRLLKGEDAG